MTDLSKARVRGTLIFSLGVAGLVVAPQLPGYWPVLLALASIEPIIYGTHEALHAEDGTVEEPGVYFPKHLATVGMSLQFMNIEILRVAHLFHHRTGRYGDGWAPDVTPGPPTALQKIHYYAGLVFLPAFMWQGACWIRPLFPLSRQPHLTGIGYRGHAGFRYLIGQLLVVAYIAYFISSSSLIVFILYWLGFGVLWSLQQNIAHYGLRGFDSATDRVCARTYLLPAPARWITFGSTSHFLHHVDQTLGSEQLNDPEALIRAESHFGIVVVRKVGLAPYIRDILRQFKGPMPAKDLTLEWIESSHTPEPVLKRSVEAERSFRYRHGRGARTSAGSDR